MAVDRPRIVAHRPLAFSIPFAAACTVVLMIACGGGETAISPLRVEDLRIAAEIQIAMSDDVLMVTGVSPDGEGLLVASRPHRIAPEGPDAALWLVTLDGIAKMLTDDLAREFAYHWPFSRNFFSPDGAEVAYVTGSGCPETGGDRFSVAVVDVENGQTRCLASDVTGLHGWLPDGRLLFARGGPPGDAELWQIRSDGSDERQLTQFPAFDPSPDGAFAVREKPLSGRGRSAIVSLTAHGEIDLQGAPLDVSGRRTFWAPDSKKYLYAGIGSDDTASMGLRLINVHDGEDRFLLEALPETLVWSPDSNVLLFQNTWSADEPIQPLFAINADGSGLGELVPEGRRAYSRAHWPGDGGYMFFGGGDQIWVAIMDTGRESDEEIEGRITAIEEAFPQPLGLHAP